MNPMDRMDHSWLREDGSRLRIWAYMATFDPAWGGGIAPDAHDDATIVGICSCTLAHLAGCGMLRLGQVGWMNQQSREGSTM